MNDKEVVYFRDKLTDLGMEYSLMDAKWKSLKDYIEQLQSSYHEIYKEQDDFVLLQTSIILNNLVSVMNSINGCETYDEVIEQHQRRLIESGLKRENEDEI